MEWLNRLWTALWEGEPLTIVALVDAVLVLAVTFGLSITNDQKTAIDAVLVAVGLLIARSQVTPAAKVAQSPPLMPTTTSATRQ